MGKFVKIVKNRTYFSRYQVKYKRRRECKTDYKARKRLIIQDKNKYYAPKYRFVVRFTNKDIICQLFSSTLTYDRCLCSAYSHELKRYGIKLGLTNYAAAYCTGLLLARRTNKKYGLDEIYPGVTEDIGEYYEVEPEGGRNPFCAYLDVGLKPTTTGSRLWGCLKGAVDGGLDIPFSERRFPRPKSDSTTSKDWEADYEFHRKYIFGGHIAEYMNKLKDDDEEAFKKQFSAYIKEGLEAEDLEGVYEAAHKGIREDPNKERGSLELGSFKVREKAVDPSVVHEKKKWPGHLPIRLTIHQRKTKIKAKLHSMGKGTVLPRPGIKRIRKSERKKALFNTRIKKAEDIAKRKKDATDRLAKKKQKKAARWEKEKELRKKHKESAAAKATE